MAAKFQDSFPKKYDDTDSDPKEAPPKSHKSAKTDATHAQPYTTGGARLQPLEGRGSDIKYSQPHPNYRKKIGKGEAGEEHIISVPEVPGVLQAAGSHLSGDTVDSPRYPIRTHEALETVIYFEDKKGILLRVQDGQNATAGDLFQLVMEEINFPEVAHQAFSLWLVSDNLELQLKPDHVPFKLAAYWEELLEKYTSTSQVDMERDEPVLVFRKNIFYPRSDDEMIRSPELIRLLYHEQKELVIDGRYPLPLDKCVYLAGIQALIQHGGYQPLDHTPEYYQDKLDEYYPKHFTKCSVWTRLFNKSETPEAKLADAHNRAYQKYKNLCTEGKFPGLYEKYLNFLRRLPYYGAAFFRGQVEQPGKPHLFDKTDNPVFVAVNTEGVFLIDMDHHDDPVFLAVNTEGVFLIDMDDHVFLFGLLYNKMAWNYAEPRDAENKGCMPCIFFQFTDIMPGGMKMKGITQVFTKEAKLIDLLMLSCLELNKDRVRRGQELVKLEDLDNDGVIEGTDEVWRDAQRLCIAHFDENAGCFIDDHKIKKVGRTKRASNPA